MSPFPIYDTTNHKNAEDIFSTYLCRIRGEFSVFFNSKSIQKAVVSAAQNRLSLCFCICGDKLIREAERENNALIGRRFLIFLSPAFINIILIFTPWRTKDSIRVSGDKSLPAMLATAERLFIVSQHKAEHHLNAE